eukprot:13216-Heterococcus_DN1.PRE.1
MFIAAVCEQVTTQQRPSVPAVTVTSVTDEDSNNSSNGRSSSAAQPAVLFEKVYGNYGETARTAFGGTCLVGQLLQAANGQLLREAYICADAKLCLFTSQQEALTALINSDKTARKLLLIAFVLHLSSTRAALYAHAHRKSALQLAILRLLLFSTLCAVTGVFVTVTITGEVWLRGDDQQSTLLSGQELVTAFFNLNSNFNSSAEGAQLNGQSYNGGTRRAATTASNATVAPTETPAN